MATPFFVRSEPLNFNPDNFEGLGFRHYDADRMVGGKRLEDHPRFAVRDWHSFVWLCTDLFGGDTFQRDWKPADTIELVKRKANPELFAYAAGTARVCIDVTHRMGGENNVLRGGREGYEMLPNTNLMHEDAKLGRFLNLVVEYKHKIGFEGAILFEPKLQKPTKHQYDFDVVTIYELLLGYGLEHEAKVNLEQGHANLCCQSLDTDDLLAVHAGAFSKLLADRNAGSQEHDDLLEGKPGLEPLPVFGQQEMLENIVNTYV